MTVGGFLLTQLTQKDIDRALEEISVELVMRNNMLIKSIEERKQKYWQHRIDRMNEVMTVLKELGKRQGFAV